MNDLKQYIRLLLSETNSKPYSKDILDDESVHKTSVLVPDDIKEKIFAYFNSMKLSKKSKIQRVS